MPLMPLFGHQALRARLDAQVARGALPASLLLQGPPGIGKQQLALWLGRRLICAEPNSPCGECRDCQYAANGNHPDLRWFFPRPRLKDANDISLEDAARERDEAVADRLGTTGLYARPDGSSGIFAYHTRLLVADAVRTPALAHRKVFVIGDAERMSAQAGAEVAANALLKLLEEPLPDTTLILTSSEPGALLPTIRSRVVTVRVTPLRDEEVREFLAHPAVAAALGPGRTEDRVRRALGAPGNLIGATDADAIGERAKLLLDAATGTRDAMLRTAFIQGSSKSRGAFTDVLDAVTALLHERTQTAVQDGDASRAAAFAAIRDNAIAKGDVLGVARIAGIQAAKRTPELIPLCHPLAITSVEVECTLLAALPGVEVRATVKTVGQTGVEMEAMTAASVALLTVYDMAKSADKAMVIEQVRLLEKSGGKSGTFRAR